MGLFGSSSARAVTLAAFLVAMSAVVFTGSAGAQEASAEPEATDAAALDAPEAEAGADEAGAAEETAETGDEASADEGDPASEDGAGEAADEDSALDEDGLEEGALEEEEGADGLDAPAAGRLQPVADLVDAGGPIIVILGILSIISLAIIIVKIVQFATLRVGDHKFVEKIAQQLKDGEHKKALDVLSRRRGVIARVMETALRGRMLSDDETHVREEVERVARAKLDGLERGLPLLSLVATISPLLGLLGTVLGMIEAFQQLENAGDRVDPAILSGGIWEALLTTAAGLSVAIPAAAFFTWLQRSVEVAGQHMEDAATRVFTAALYEEAARGDKDDAAA